jgi:glycosyltransferase involved in cell wall biosynthesis
VGAAEFVPPDGGIVVEDPNDTEAIVDALRQLVASPDRREEMGRVARDTARQHDIRITANKYVDLFERLLQRWDGLKQPA